MLHRSAESGYNIASRVLYNWQQKRISMLTGIEKTFDDGKSQVKMRFDNNGKVDVAGEFKMSEKLSLGLSTGWNMVEVAKEGKIKNPEIGMELKFNI